MTGCLRRVGCLIVLVVLVLAVWLTRGWWLPRLPFRASPAVVGAPWESPSDSGAGRAAAAIAALRRDRGPAYVNVAPGDLLAYLRRELARSLPQSAESLRATVIGERLYVEASVRTADLGREALGPLASLVGARERVRLGGALRVVRPGLMEFLVRDVQVRDLALPQPMVAPLIRQLAGRRPEGISDAGLPIPTPEYIGDVRVARGRITLYRGP